MQLNNSKLKNLFAYKIPIKINIATILICTLYIVFIINFIFYFFHFAYSLYMIDYTYAMHNMFLRVLAIFIPPSIWILSTISDTFNYYRCKLFTYILIAANTTLILSGIVFQLLSWFFLPHVVHIQTDNIFTKDMVLFLARLITEVPLLPFFYLTFKAFMHPIKKGEKSRSDILSFKITNYLSKSPSAKTRPVTYSLSIARSIHTGKPIVISEKDRFLHTLVDGTSGTGKTSSTILPAIKNDLNMRCSAEKQQLEHLSPLLASHSISYNGRHDFFSITGFSPSASLSQESQENIKSDLEYIRLNSPVCGITILAPDDSLTDSACSLCIARKIPFHRIDATRDENGKRKLGWTGMNPFYLSDKLIGESRHQAIVKKAIVFSDVMQVITDLKGRADSYFTGLNRQMISNLSILIMNTIPSRYKRQATPADLQALINNFDLLPEHVSELEVIDSKERRYTFILQYVKEDLLGKGRTKMEDQTRGTRNIINEFLLMPHFREVYCSQSSIDFDQVLENGEITVCNYDLASGDTNAIAFGLFFLLSFNNAVLSRPGTESTRLPHFFYIDELPVLLHSSLEKNFSLFRKFRVAMFCAIQTIDQFEKNELTKYLKGVVLGSAHIFVFGRSSIADMEVFSSMSGTEDKIEEQNSISQTALSGDSPSLSFSSRETVAKKNVLEEIDIRLRDFQEITLFTTQNGRPLPPIHAKVSFLKPSDWDPLKILQSPYFSFAKVIYQNEETSESVAAAKDSPILDKSIIKLPQNFTTRYSTNFSQTLECEENDSKEASTNEQRNLPNGSESIEDLF